MAGQVVPHTICPVRGRRSFRTEHDAELALARAQRHRSVKQDARYYQESRYYPCGHCDGFHLTHKSRKEYDINYVSPDRRLMQELRALANL